MEYKVVKESIPRADPYLSAKLVFLADVNAMSWAETVLMIVKGYKLGTIIGTNTAGTNGDATWFLTPLFDFRMTGLHVSNIDGSQHHGIGVIPDIEVHQTYESFINGKDNLLEAAHDYLRNM